jgi:hypothetical protein
MKYTAPKKIHQSPTRTAHGGILYFRIQNGFIKSVAMVHKVQQFDQIHFSAPDVGHIG